jgi:hypothetical protein
MNVLSVEKDENFNVSGRIHVTIRARQLNNLKLDRLWKAFALGCAPINLHHYDTPGNLGFDPKVQCIYYCTVYSQEELKFDAFLRAMKDLEDQKIKEDDLTYQAESMFAMLKKNWMA